MYLTLIEHIINMEEEIRRDRELREKRDRRGGRRHEDQRRERRRPLIRQERGRRQLSQLQRRDSGPIRVPERDMKERERRSRYTKKSCRQSSKRHSAPIANTL